MLELRKYQYEGHQDSRDWHTCCNIRIIWQRLSQCQNSNYLSNLTIYTAIDTSWRAEFKLVINCFSIITPNIPKVGKMWIAANHIIAKFLKSDQIS